MKAGVRIETKTERRVRNVDQAGAGFSRAWGQFWYLCLD